MNIVIIPGFTGYPEEKTFTDLESNLLNKGHHVIKIAWPNFPDNLKDYNFTSTTEHIETILKEFDMKETVLLGFSMGGVIACHLARVFKPYKLGLIVTPYQAGSEDDLQGKYRSWKELGYRDLTSSRFGNLRIPFSFIQDARKYNALETISEINCPILFIVGEKDDKVPNSVTRKLFDKANEPKQWVKVDGMEHKYQYQPDMLKEVNQFIIDFICS